MCVYIIKYLNKASILKNIVILCSITLLLFVAVSEESAANSDLITAYPDTIITQSATNSEIELSTELKNIDNITHNVLLSAVGSHITYQELYELPSSQIIIKPNETKTILLKVVANGTKTIKVNILDGSTAVGTLNIIIYQKTDILDKAISKLSYALIFSDKITGITMDNNGITIQSRMNKRLPYFGIAIFTSFVWFVSYLTKKIFPTLYKTNATLFSFLVLVFSFGALAV